MSFSWVPFYRELAGKVLEFEDRQDELLQFVLQMHQSGLLGETAKTLDVLDPFTFFSVLNVLGNERRIKACRFLAAEWDLSTQVPVDFNGVPEITPQNCWFFGYKADRAPDDISVVVK